VDAGSLLPGVHAWDAAHDTPLDGRPVRLEQVDAEQRVHDFTVPDRGAVPGDVHARGITSQVAPAAAVDGEALDGHVVGAHPDDAASARSNQARPADTDEHQRLVDEQVADVLAGRHLEAGAGGGSVDPGLQG
jgi:hypothetical protein